MDTFLLWFSIIGTTVGIVGGLAALWPVLVGQKTLPDLIKEIQAKQGTRRKIDVVGHHRALVVLTAAIILIISIPMLLIFLNRPSNKPVTPSIPPGVTIPYPPNKVTLVLNDPLQDNSHNYRWDNSSTSCQFARDGYHVTTAINNYTYFCNAFATNFSNFAYEVQMTILKGDSGGLVFRANADNATFYYFRVSNTGSYSLVIYTGHTSSGILQNGFTPAIHTGLGQSNLLAVVANGNHIDLYVNHMHITNVLDGTYSQGQIGVAGSTADNPPVEVVFNNAKVWKF